MVTVPNKLMVDTVVDNMSMRNKWRAEIKLTLSEKTTSNALQKLVEQINTMLQNEQKNIVKHSVVFTDYNKDGIVLVIEYFTEVFTKAEYDAVKHRTNFKVKELIEKHKLEMATTQNTTIAQPIDINPTTI